MVVIVSMGKRAHFTEMLTTIMTAKAVNLYLQSVWKLHSFPQKILSDCRQQFITAFMKELYWLLEIEAATSFAYHPQTDRQTEWVNQELEQYLWIFVREW